MSVTGCNEVLDRATVLLDTLLSDSPDSIFSVLAGILSEDPSLPHLSTVTSVDQISGSPALMPAPTINETLNKLVSILVTPRCPKVTAKVIEKLDANCGQLAPRASAVRAVAAAAERELELSAAIQICRRYDIDPSFISEEGSDVTQCSQKELGDLDSVFRVFPYVNNYKLLVTAEVNILSQPVPPLTPVSDVEISSVNGGWKESLDGLSWLSSENSTSSNKRLLEGMTIAFCGSGPMPLSAVLLHVQAGASIILIDIDEVAIRISLRLIAILEHLCLVSPGALVTVRADAANVHFRAIEPGTDRPSCLAAEAVQRHQQAPEVRCHAVILASLLEQGVKRAVAANVAAGADGPRLLLARSAHGLVSKFAYHNVVPDELANHVKYRGAWIPRRNVSDLDRKHRKDLIENGILGWIDSRVLNSVEVFTRHPN